jgi:zinc transporter ZupT
MSSVASTLFVQNMSGVLLASAASLLLSGLTVTLARRWSTPSRVKTLLGYGTGYLLALALLELAPHAWRHLDHNLLVMGALATSGAFIVWLSERFLATKRRKIRFKPLVPPGGHTHYHHHSAKIHGGKFSISHKACCGFDSFTKLDREIFFSVVTCICLCAFFDGVTLSAALMSTSQSQAYALSGVLAHMIPEVVVLGLVAHSQYSSTKKAVLYCAGATLLFILGNLTSRLSILFGASEGGILATAAGMMTYISIAHLIPKFIDGRREVFFASLGFVTFLLTDLLHFHQP